ncbi:hypothetical protein C8R44DRAFT_726843 [Mycena epipterygia]|nr:hypothetical protein C8R44DRAFT_726843 [Mycena epipterygia]
MASPENTVGSSTSTGDDDPDTSASPLTMENSLVGKLNEGHYYINKAGEEFQKCVGRLDETQIESIRQTHIRLTDQMREVKSMQEFPRCVNPKNIHKAHRFADEARHFHKHIVILSVSLQAPATPRYGRLTWIQDRSRRAMLLAETMSKHVGSTQPDL